LVRILGTKQFLTILFQKLNIDFIASLFNLCLDVGTEFKTTACPMTGIIRYMEMQQGKEGMKSQKFNKEIGATAGCTLQLLLNTTPQEKEGVRHCIRVDAWFGSFHTANEVALMGHDGIFQIKQYHALFPKDYIEEALKQAPGSIHILLDGMIQDEVKVIALGYRYSQKTVLHFVLTEMAGNSKPGIPYQMKYTNSFGNICSRYVDHPQVVSNFLLHLM